MLRNVKSLNSSIKKSLDMIVRFSTITRIHNIFFTFTEIDIRYEVGFRYTSAKYGALQKRIAPIKICTIK